MSGNERPDLCADCGGQCCLTRPGLEAPERFLGAPAPVQGEGRGEGASVASSDPAAALAALLLTGDWVLAEHVGVPWVDGVEPPEGDRRRIIRYPRPATLLERGRSGAPQDALAPCTFLGEVGCRLAFDDRPRMCRALAPSPGFECEGDWGRREAALAWLPHQGWVEEARARAARR
ncbi:MAG: hypothetical protein IPO09_06745 [Anaeromyxobacter sp.]|nr:hypothetical protein [Anaeromyxobacter sp.]MBL0277365.1 hypothetical protein [Anaeromyxobacter sp.]